LTLYKAPAHITSLNILRHDVFQKTAASNKKLVQLARLPPTIDAAREHLLIEFICKYSCGVVIN